MSNQPILSVLCAGVMLCAAGSAFSATPASSKDADARYEKERASCMNGTSNEDQKTCLKEAVAARDAEKKGQLKEADDHYRKNAMARCAVFTGDEAKDCRARASANGIVSGSVSSGGVLRESDTVTQTGVVLIPVQPAPAKP